MRCITSRVRVQLLVSLRRGRIHSAALDLDPQRSARRRRLKLADLRAGEFMLVARVLADAYVIAEEHKQII